MADNRTDTEREEDRIRFIEWSREFQFRADKRMTWEEFVKAKRFVAELEEMQYVNNLGGSIAYLLTDLTTGDHAKAMSAAKVGSLIDTMAFAAAQTASARYENRMILEPPQSRDQQERAARIVRPTSITSHSIESIISSRSPHQFEADLTEYILELGYYGQSMAAAENLPKTAGKAGTRAHTYAEYIWDGLAEELATRKGPAGNLYSLKREEFRDINGKEVSRRELSSLGLDAVLYKDGRPFIGFDLKTGKSWSKNQLEAIRKRFGPIQIIQFGLDQWKTK